MSDPRGGRSSQVARFQMLRAAGTSAPQELPLGFEPRNLRLTKAALYRLSYGSTLNIFIHD